MTVEGPVMPVDHAARETYLRSRYPRPDGQRFWIWVGVVLSTTFVVFVFLPQAFAWLSCQFNPGDQYCGLAGYVGVLLAPLIGVGVGIFWAVRDRHLEQRLGAKPLRPVLQRHWVTPDDNNDG